MALNALETVPESDRSEDTPHPRLSFNCFGHAEAERQLFLAYLAGHLPQAFIIGGPQGIGKATTTIIPQGTRRTSRPPPMNKLRALARAIM